MGGGSFQAPARVWYSPSARPKERDSSSSSTARLQAPHRIFLPRAEGSALAPRDPRSTLRGSVLGQGQPQGLWEGTGGQWRVMGAGGEGEGEGGWSGARRDELRPSRVWFRMSRVRPFLRADPRHLPSSGLRRGTPQGNGDPAPSMLPQHPLFIPATQIPAFPPFLCLWRCKTAGRPPGLGSCGERGDAVALPEILGSGGPVPQDGAKSTPSHIAHPRQCRSHRLPLATAQGSAPRGFCTELIDGTSRGTGGSQKCPSCTFG